jgi:hypothetical protein
MRRVPPSVIVRDELDRLLAKGADRLGTRGHVTRLAVQQFLETDQADFLGGRAATIAGRAIRLARATATSATGFVPTRERSACAFPTVAVRTSLTARA